MSTDWLEIARNQAEERYRSLPLPTAKDENYRFSPLELPLGEVLPLVETALPAEAARLDEGEEALLTVRGDEAESWGELHGALFTDLLRAVVLGLDSVRARLRDPALFAQDKFAQLTAARWQNGVFLHVPGGVKMPAPLRAFISAQAGESHFRHLITVEEGAEATLVMELHSAEDAAYISELTEVRLGKGAKLHWVILQRLSSSAKFVLRQRLDLAEGAELRVTPLHLGGGSIQLRQESALGKESSLELSGAARGDRSQHFDFWLDVDHAGARSRSETNFSFVMGGSSKAVFNGLVRIGKDVPECVAAQKSKSLLLGSKATVHAMPKLIIQTDNVKCGHGASVASVNPEQVHYLQSRGISRPEAERMIVRGFTEAVLERLPTEGLQARADLALDQKGWIQ